MHSSRALYIEKTSNPFLLSVYSSEAQARMNKKERRLLLWDLSGAVYKPPLSFASVSQLYVFKAAASSKLPGYF